MARRFKRTVRRRGRTGRRRGRRGGLRRKVMRINRTVRRLWKQNEIKSAISVINALWAPISIEPNAVLPAQNFNNNVYHAILSHPVRTVVAAGTLNDSTFVGNQFSPLPLEVRLTLSVGQPTVGADQSSYELFPSTCYVRIVIFQVKGGDPRYDPTITSNGIEYHPLGFRIPFNYVGSDQDARPLQCKQALYGFAANVQDNVPLYYGTHTAPFRTGITQWCRILAHRRYRLTNMDRQSLNVSFKTRRPSTIVHVEVPSGDETIPITAYPSNACYFHALVTWDRYTIARYGRTGSEDNQGNFRPRFSMTGTINMKYRDN